MARVKHKEQTGVRPRHTCAECANSYDWHSNDIKGNPILCRCQYKGEGGKWCIFLRDPQCDNYKPRATHG